MVRGLADGAVMCQATLPHVLLGLEEQPEPLAPLDISGCDIFKYSTQE